MVASTIFRAIGTHQFVEKSPGQRLRLVQVSSAGGPHTNLLPLRSAKGASGLLRMRSSIGIPVMKILKQESQETGDISEKQEIRTMKRGISTFVSDSDKEEILEMIEFGWSDDQILQMLPHIERGSITAFRAHVTRGTYGPGESNGTSRRGRRGVDG